jgi:hypothetical protein
VIVDEKIEDISVGMSSVIALVVVELTSDVLDKRVDESTEIVVAFGVVIFIVT